MSFFTVFFFSFHNWCTEFRGKTYSETSLMNTCSQPSLNKNLVFPCFHLLLPLLCLVLVQVPDYQHEEAVLHLCTITWVFCWYRSVHTEKLSIYQLLMYHFKIPESGQSIWSTYLLSYPVWLYIILFCETLYKKLHVFWWIWLHPIKYIQAAQLNLIAWNYNVRKWEEYTKLLFC